VNLTKQSTNKPTDNLGIQFTFTGTTAFTGIAIIDGDGVSSDIKDELITSFETELETIGFQSESIQSCNVKVSNFNAQPIGTRSLLSLNRRLQDWSIIVEYKVVVAAVCADSDCSDAQFAREISNTAYNQVTGKLIKALDDGSLTKDIINASSAEIADLLENGE